ncbi:hypothetical protein D3C87_1098450 [compost metagenome]
MLGIPGAVQALAAAIDETRQLVVAQRAEQFALGVQAARQIEQILAIDQRRGRLRARRVDAIQRTHVEIAGSEQIEVARARAQHAEQELARRLILGHHFGRRAVGNLGHQIRITLQHVRFGTKPHCDIDLAFRVPQHGGVLVENIGAWQARARLDRRPFFHAVMRIGQHQMGVLRMGPQRARIGGGRIGAAHQAQRPRLRPLGQHGRQRQVAALLARAILGAQRHHGRVARQLDQRAGRQHAALVQRQRRRQHHAVDGIDAIARVPRLAFRERQGHIRRPQHGRHAGRAGQAQAGIELHAAR